MVSRRRRGLSILTAGRDHLTHRTHAAVPDRSRRRRRARRRPGGHLRARGDGADAAARPRSSIAVVAYLVGLGVAIALLDSRFAPAPRRRRHARDRGRRAVRRRTWPRSLLLIPLAVGIAVSPFFFGYYDATIWAPVGMALLGVATAGLIARPPPLGLPATLLLAGIVGHRRCGRSRPRAGATRSSRRSWRATAGWRTRRSRSCCWSWCGASASRSRCSAALGVGCVGVGVAVLVRMLGSDPGDLFLGGRLHAPLGLHQRPRQLPPARALALRRRRGAQARGRRRRGSRRRDAAGRPAAAHAVARRGARGGALARSSCWRSCPGASGAAGRCVVVVGAVALAAPALLDVYPAASTAALPVDVGHRAARHLGVRGRAGGRRLGRRGLGRRAAATAARCAGPPPRRWPSGVIVAVAVGLASAGPRSRTRSTASTPPSSGSASSPRAPRQRALVASRQRLGQPLRLLARRLGRVEGGADARRRRGQLRPPVLRPPRDDGGHQAAALDRAPAAERARPRRRRAVRARARRDRAGRAPRDRRGRAAARTRARSRSRRSASWSRGWCTRASTGSTCCPASPRSPSWPRSASCAGRSRRAESRAGADAPLAPGVGVALVRDARGGQPQPAGALGALRERGAIRARDRTRPTALREADRALRLDPEAMGAYYAKAAALARFNEAGAAKAALREAARREPGDYVTWALLGRSRGAHRATWARRGACTGAPWRSTRAIRRCWRSRAILAARWQKVDLPHRTGTAY